MVVPLASRIFAACSAYRIFSSRRRIVAAQRVARDRPAALRAGRPGRDRAIAMDKSRNSMSPFFILQLQKKRRSPPDDRPSSRLATAIIPRHSGRRKEPGDPVPGQCLAEVLVLEGASRCRSWAAAADRAGRSRV